MIVAILKSIGFAILVGLCFAAISFLLVVIISSIAMREFRKQNGDMYDFDEQEQEKNRIIPIGWEKLINNNKNNDSNND